MWSSMKKMWPSFGIQSAANEEADHWFKSAMRDGLYLKHRRAMDPVEMDYI